MMSSMMIVIFSTLCMAVFAVIAVVWWTRKALGIPRSGPLGRIAQWAEGVRTSEAEVRTATVGDLVLFVTLYVVGVTLVITLYTWQAGSAMDKYKQESEQLRQTVNTLQSEIISGQRDLADLKEQQAAPQLIVPGADEEIIGEHVDLHWQYGNHNETTDYVLQLMRIAGFTGDNDTQKVAHLSAPTLTDLRPGVPCIVAATDSADQQSRAALGPGTYMWRVAVGALNGPAVDSKHCANDDRVREWSEYRTFRVYPSMQERLESTKELLAGTRFEQDIPFSRVGPDGKPTGFDMDFLKIIVEHCLVLQKDGAIHYNRDECNNEVSALKDGEPLEDLEQGTPGHLRLRIVPMPAGVNWLEKLQSRHIDLYIGSVTRAKKREYGGVTFTNGYLNYSSEAIFRTSEACSSIDCLAQKRGKVGVVESTTNAWLADELKKRIANLNVVTYKSFPALESAFEREEVAVVITDGVMASTMGLNETKRLAGKALPGWKSYLVDHIGYPEEQFAIAVVKDTQSKNDAAANQLLTQLNCAINDHPAQTLIAILSHKYQLDKLGTSYAAPTLGSECKSIPSSAGN